MPNSSVWSGVSAYSFCQLNWRERVLNRLSNRPFLLVSARSSLWATLKWVRQSGSSLPLTKADSVYSSLSMRRSSVGLPLALSYESWLLA
ncbi:hypothetical protein D3C86_1401990 [compost metagenome]